MHKTSLFFLFFIFNAYSAEISITSTTSLLFVSNLVFIGLSLGLVIKLTRKPKDHFELYLKTLIENLPQRIFVKTSRYILCNQPFASQFNRQAAELHKMQDADLYPSHLIQKHQESDYKIMQGQLRKYWEEINEGEDWFHSYKIPIKDKHKIIGILGITENINAVKTQQNLPQLLEKHTRQKTVLLEEQNRRLQIELKKQKKMEAALRWANAEIEKAYNIKSDFLASMSHEIRTPMNVIISCSELLSENCQQCKNQEQGQYIEMLRLAGNTLLGLINNILDYSKLEEKKLETEHLDFDLKDFVSEVETIMQLRAQANNNSLISVIDPDVPARVNGDPLRTKQILINLISNAVKFTHDGEIILRTQRNSDPRRKGNILFSVQDNGAGISPEKQEQIFEKFIQADNSITREHGGSGLGLAIARDLTQLMGGEIWVKSIPQVKTIFYFTINFQLPVNSKARELPRNEEDILSDSFLGHRLLLVDDSEENRTIVRALLKNTQIAIEEVTDGLAAIEQIKKKRFDIVLMDVQMPKLDGLEATKRIRQWEQQNNKEITPIIALTAHALHEDYAKSIRAGCTDHISKPIKKKILIDVIKQQLKKEVLENVS